MLAATPELLKNIVAAGGDSFPNDFSAVGESVFFAANSRELWKTDGTSAGTVLVKDTGAGVGGVSLRGLTAHNGQLVFQRLDCGADCSFFALNDDRLQLWKSDGTSAGTVLFKDFGLGSSVGISDGSYFTSIGGKLYIPVSTPSFGFELWKTDLTSSGTTLLKDINPNPGVGSSPYSMFDYKGMLIFSASDGSRGVELWKSDGTSAGTVLVKDIETVSSPYGGNVGSIPTGFVRKGDNFFFGVRRSGTDNIPFNEDDTVQLWKSNGTTAGTTLVRDVGVGSSGDSFANVNGTLFAQVRTAATGSELWKSDGTSAGTVLLKDIQPGTDAYGDPLSSFPSRLTPVGGRLYFTADDGSIGAELWRSDGTTAGTIPISDINPGVGDASIYAYPQLIHGNGTLYFSADNGSIGAELWKSNGTSAGTTLVQDLNPGPSGSAPFSVTNVNGSLYFTATDGSAGVEPWILRNIGGGQVDEIAVKRSNEWFADANNNGEHDPNAGDAYFKFGNKTGDVPLVGDWNGDGDDDIGVKRGNQWLLDLSGNGAWGAGDVSFFFGTASDVPITGDWDGDGDDDVGVKRGNQWLLDSSGNRDWGPGDSSFFYGASSDVPVIGDWNGDGVSDIGVKRNAQWYLDFNGDHISNAGDLTPTFGNPADVPIAGDWDGDGDDNIGVKRNAQWFFDVDSNGIYNALDDTVTYGAVGDVPIIGKFNSPGTPLQATGRPAAGAVVTPLSESDLAPIVQQAVGLLGNLNLNVTQLTALRNVSFAMDDLSGSRVGEATGGTVVFDSTAAGHGWFIDATPGSNEEYESQGGQLTARASGPAAERMDLLSVALHELGHVLGYEHDELSSELAALMSAELPAGVRRLPNL